MSKTNLISSLFKIDAAEGFVRYVNAVKPYHSKILDVLIEYIYKEDVRASVTEKWTTDVHQFHTTSQLSLADAATRHNMGDAWYVPATSMCYFMVDDSAITPGPGGSFVVQGWHAEKFKTGNRVRVAFSDGTAKTFIVASSSNIPDVLLNNTYRTRIQIVQQQVMPTTGTVVPTTALLAFTPDYRITAATTGTNGAWIIDGDFRDEFQVGERVIIAGVPSSGGVYTIKSTPMLGYAASHEYTKQSTPSYDVVGVKHSSLTGNVGMYAITPGEWVVLGTLADVLVPGQHMHVDDDSQSSSTFYKISNVREDVYANIQSNTSYITQPNTDYLNFEIDGVTPRVCHVTIITVDPGQEIPSSATPTGKLHCPIVPRYDVVDKTTNTFTVVGRHGVDAGASYTATTPFKPNDHFFLVDNDHTPANREYVVVSAVNDPVINKTVITVAGTIPTSTTVSGHIQHPTRVTTIIPVHEPVFELANQRGEYYKTFTSGVLRYLPTIVTQVAPPSSPVVGTVWVDPITNVSRRWTGTTWVHNYTPTCYAWGTDQVNQNTRTIIKKATAQDVTNANTFTVDTTNAYQSHTFSVTSTAANQFMFSKSFEIIDVNQTANYWEARGNVDVVAGEVIYVNSSSARYGVGTYVVSHVVPFVTTTRVYVTRQISRLASPDGMLAVPYQPEDVPRWVEGTRVKVTGSLPNPLASDTPYYFMPIIRAVEEGGVETPPIFALATVRSPHQHDDYVDITSLGSGVLTLTQDELFVPGSRIKVRDTHYSRNDGTYTIISSANTSADTAVIRVAERIRASTPSTLLRDGVVEYSVDSHAYSSLTERSCATSDRSELHASAHVTEFIEFAFTMEEFDYIAARLGENEDNQLAANDIGFDADGNDMSGWDGNLILLNNDTSLRAATATFSHNIIPVGFDTQYFDVGGIDETLESVSRNYGKSMPPPPMYTAWDADYRRRPRSPWNGGTVVWDAHL